MEAIVTLRQTISLGGLHLRDKTPHDSADPQ